MKIDLNGIPFDHYQRYATAASLVLTLGDGTQVLEVGANRQRLLGDFLPQSTLLYTDILPEPDAPDFVVADANDLPFEDQAYQAVVSLDVLEHIPPEKRRDAVSEMARVAERLLVIGCPIDRPWVHAAEHEAHAIWRRYFDQPYPWLEEHDEFGLVDPSQVEQVLAEAGMTVVRFGHGDARLWSALMGIHFIKEAVPELAGVAASADRYYNAALFAGDRATESYREFFVGVRHTADLGALRSAVVLNGVADGEGASFLASLSQRLQPVADRVREAERGWRKTAEILTDTETRLRKEALARHQSILDAQEAARGAIEQIEYVKQQWQQTATRLEEADAQLKYAHEQWKQTANRLEEGESRHQTASAEAEARLRYAQDQWKQTADRFEDTERRLQAEAAAHHQTGLQLRDLSEHAVALEVKVDALRMELESSRLESQERDAQLEVTRRSIREMESAADLAETQYREHLQRLSARVISLERRQRFILIVAGLLSVAAIVALLAIRSL